MSETKIGRVTHYWPKAGAAAVNIERGSLSVGDWIHIVGHGHDFTQRVESIQVEHKPVEKAGAGTGIGIKVDAPVHDKDVVFKVKTGFWSWMPW